jgi:hypothetical protein
MLCYERLNCFVSMHRFPFRGTLFSNHVRRIIGVKTAQTKQADQDAKIRRCLNVALHVHFLYPSLHLMFEHPMMLPNYARINARDEREKKNAWKSSCIMSATRVRFQPNPK